MAVSLVPKSTHALINSCSQLINCVSDELQLCKLSFPPYPDALHLNQNPTQLTPPRLNILTLPTPYPSCYAQFVAVAAGISGVSMAYHLKTKCPGKKFVVLESRGEIGGTWSLFNYPGIRSDSDMHVSDPNSMQRGSTSPSLTQSLHNVTLDFRFWMEAVEQDLRDQPGCRHYG